MSLDPRPVSLSRVIMTELVLPSLTNSLGGAFGGSVMSWIDIAGAICAQRHCRNIVVTASVDDLHFIAPIYEGWICNLKASLNFTGKTSMEVGVRVDAENPRTGDIYHTVSAYLTFVSFDKESRRPLPVAPVLAETDEDKRRYAAGEKRRELRLQRREMFRKK